MGLRMDDIHAPTVASGPTSNGGATRDSSQKPLLELMDERDRVQSELLALGSVLETHHVDMQTPLLTPDGFPRADIDVAQIRTTRARIVRLKNDYKWLMEKIEKGLEDFHTNSKAQQSNSATNGISPPHSQTSTANNASSMGLVPTHTEFQPPFAKVNSIANGSPADTAGLLVGDKIVAFGHVNFTNHERLSRVAQSVQASEGREISLKVLRSSPEDGRSSATVDLKLTPRHNWGGRGMLGCHLIPL